MRDAREERLAHVLDRYGAVWAVYYALAMGNFGGFVLVNFLNTLNCGYGHNPYLIFIFTFIYLLICVYSSSPKSLIRKGHPYRYNLVKQIFVYAVVVDVFVVCFLVGCSAFGIDNDIILLLGITIQSGFFNEIVLVYLVNFIDLSPVEIFMSVRVNLARDITSPGMDRSGVEFVIVLLYLLVFGFLTVAATLECLFIWRPVVCLFMMFCVIWTHYILFYLYIAVNSVNTLMDITSPANNEDFRNLSFSFMNALKKIGLFSYLGLLSILFGAVDVFKSLIWYQRWSAGMHGLIEEKFARTCPMWYFYRLYGLETVLIGSFLFETTPSAAVNALKTVFIENGESFSNSFKTSSSRRSTRLVSVFSLLTICLPTTLIITSSTLFCNPTYFMYLGIVAWGTFAFAAIPYIKTETIHKTVLLAYSQKILATNRSIEHHLIAVQAT
ncbi:hypothetical protein NEDG_01024 [Nematocida displodere]|uniref:Uncharacterized protein n=1 Tax=Nematocida displodere TaxID=1805483 RepID=A0A177EAE3_9MICR|nr:hypothetical protein NEDG_01024 [Nematocida displodere]